MPIESLTFVSSNEEKNREIRGALAGCGVAVARVALDLPEIQSLDPAQVAGYKARLAFEHFGAGAVLVEDTGLAILAWNGYPGALIKWVLGAMGEPGLCRQLDAWDDRRAQATVALCLYDGHALHTFSGQTTGAITREPRGTHGFGWDSIFQPDGYTLTYGEMPREDKMRISMRARALEALRDFLLAR
jgi:non-canonical purine NTP pyrophosphatase (RdgB/HAM1 family)